MSNALQSHKNRSILNVNTAQDAATQTSLFCLPFAGGSAQYYKSWEQEDLGPLSACAIELPGRGFRLRDPLVADFCDLVEELTDTLSNAVTPPYALFGHSLGALLAFEVTRALEKSGGPLPVHLFLSACRAPHVTRRIRPWHDLPEDDLIAEVVKLNGTSPESLEDPDIRAMMIPVFRTDFRLGEEYTYVPQAPIKIPISVFGGTSDPLVQPEELKAWSEHTSDFRGCHLFPGGHFYLNTHASDVISTIRAELASDLAPDSLPKLSNAL